MVVRTTPVTVASAHVHGLADNSRSYQLARVCNSGIMAHRETQDQSAIVLRHQRHARFRFSRRPVTISGSKHNLSLRRVTCPGLFAENVLTGIQGSRGDGGEILMWCRYNDRIDVFALKQFLPVRAA